jgi:hypothetical protein
MFFKSCSAFTRAFSAWAFSLSALAFSSSALLASFRALANSSSFLLFSDSLSCSISLIFPQKASLLSNLSASSVYKEKWLYPIPYC